MKRNELSEKDTWDLTPLYPNSNSWNKSYDSTFSSPLWEEISSFKEKLHNNPNCLSNCLAAYFSLLNDIEKLYTWAHLKADEDTKNNEYSGLFQKAQMLYHKFASGTSWFEPALLSLSNEILCEIKTCEPRFSHYIDTILHNKEHTLSEKEESIIAASSLSLSTSVKTFSAMNNADLQFPDAIDGKGKSRPLTTGSYSRYMKEDDRNLRESAYNNLHSEYKKYENTFAELLLGHIRTHHFVSQTKNYTSTLHAALHPQNIPTAIYRNLIEATANNLQPLHDYVEFKKELLDLPEFYAYDIQYCPQPIQKTYTFDEAVSLVVDSSAPMGEEYQEILQKGLTVQRWVDPYETQNKRSGAYSSGCYGSAPYILTNFQGTLRDVFTLAHEAGHSMHSYYARKAQPFHYADYTIFLAEIASTFHEHLLTDYLTQNISSAEEKKFLLLERIEDLRATFFRQVQFAEFELFTHMLVEQNMPLTADLLNNKHLELNNKYYGSAFNTPESGVAEWARIPHFYANYYVYQYATGIAASLVFNKKLKQDPETTVKTYINFLKSGSSSWSTDILLTAGIDLQKPEVIEEAISSFKDLLARLKNLALKTTGC